MYLIAAKTAGREREVISSVWSFESVDLPLFPKSVHIIASLFVCLRCAPAAEAAAAAFPSLITRCCSFPLSLLCPDQRSIDTSMAVLECAHRHFSLLVFVERSVVTIDWPPFLSGVWLACTLEASPPPAPLPLFSDKLAREILLLIAEPTFISIQHLSSLLPISLSPLSFYPFSPNAPL